MKKLIVLFFLVSLAFDLSAQGRAINKLTLQTTYSNQEIHQALRDLVDKHTKAEYFVDEFFNSFLKKILLDKQFSVKEKVQLFYLMQKKLGYAFVGVNYLPPKQNYFVFHTGKVQVYQKTKLVLRELKLNPAPFLALVESHQTSDPVISANALFLSTLLNSDSAAIKLQKFSLGQTIMKSKNPAIFNHYVCLSSSIVQNKIVTEQLVKNLKVFTQGCMLEDVICALYSKNPPVSHIRDYILFEQKQTNKLAIETALSVLYVKVPIASFKESVKSLTEKKMEPWKNDLLQKLLAEKIPFNYEITHAELLVPKVWEYVQITIYNDGTLISNNTLLEFDPN